MGVTAKVSSLEKEDKKARASRTILAVAIRIDATTLKRPSCTGADTSIGRAVAFLAKTTPHTKAFVVLRGRIVLS